MFSPLFVLACATPTGGDGNGDGTIDSVAPEAKTCHGAAQTIEPLSNDIDELSTRWDRNSELLRILFIGSPT